MDRFKKGNKCVFCRSYGVDLHSPKDQDSFNIIIQSALTRNDDVIKSLQNSELRDIFYHADCRKTYVHKKTLQNNKKYMGLRLQTSSCFLKLK